MAGAGFVIFRYFGGRPKFLGLIGPVHQQRRCNGIYDIPKGVINLGETRLEAAVRETEEEAGYDVTPEMIFDGPYTDGALTVWMVEVFTDPIIISNPDTGIMEHHGFEWLDPDELCMSCYDYLEPCIEWAMGVIIEN